MRESVRGRGRVASDAGPGARSSGKEAAEGKRKLRKGRSPGLTPTRGKSGGRSSSVPPPGSEAGEEGGGLFAGTEIEKRHLAALEPWVSPIRLTGQQPQSQLQLRPQPRPLSRQQQQQQVTPTPSPSTVKRQMSVRKPPPSHPEVGVKEGYTVTVLGSSNSRPDVTRSGSVDSGRRASVDAPPRSRSPAQGQGQLSRDSSVRSAASAPVGTSAPKKMRKVSGSGKPMPSFAGVVGEAGDSLVRRQSGQVAGPSASASASASASMVKSAGANASVDASSDTSVGANRGVVKAVQVGMEMEIPRAPPRVGEVLQKESEGRHREDLIRGLQEVKAPGSVFDRVEGLPVVSQSTLSPFMSGSGGAGGQPSRALGGSESPASSGASGSISAEGTGRKTRPAVSPLRSALRNPSRTPSPMPGSKVQPSQAEPRPQSEIGVSERGSRTVVSSSALSPTPAPAFPKPGQLEQI
ncbi:hypothetical protein C0995_013907, partial [Termitomyces sp. Mi166